MGKIQEDDADRLQGNGRSLPTIMFSKNVLKLVTGTAIAQGIGIVTMPVITRLFGPDTFGVFGLFSSVAGVLGAIACFRYELAIMLPREEARAISLLVASITFACFTSVGIAMLGYFRHPVVTAFLDAKSLTDCIYLLPPVVFFIATYQSLFIWTSRRKSFGRASTARVIQTVMSQTVAIGYGLFGMTAGVYLVISRMLGQLLSVLFLLGGNYKDIKKLIKKISLKSTLRDVKRYKNFPKFGIWSGLLVSFSMELPVILLSFYFTSPEVGSFVLMSRILRLPYNLIGDSISQVLFQSASEIGADRTRLPKIMKDICDRQLVISVFPLLTLSLVGKELFITVFGSDWGIAGQMAQWYCFAAFVEFNLAPFGCLFNVMEEQKKALVLNINLMGFRFMFLLIGMILGDVMVSVALFTLGDILGRLIKFQWIFKKSFFSLTIYFKRSFPILGVSTPLFILLFALAQFQFDALFYLCSYGILSVLYFVCLHLFYVPLSDLFRG